MKYTVYGYNAEHVKMRMRGVEADSKQQAIEKAANFNPDFRIVSAISEETVEAIRDLLVSNEPPTSDKVAELLNQL